MADDNPRSSKKSKTDDKCTLHSYWRSSCSWRVRIALALKEVEYSYQAVHLLQDGGVQYSDTYTLLNPNQRVPTLEIDGHVLTQSMAILEYLEETRSGQQLLPEKAVQRAAVREICGIIGCDIQPVQNLAVLKKVMSYVEDKNTVKMEWGKDVITRGFKAVEARLKKTAGNFCFGDEITMADVFLVPQVYNANRFQVDMDLFPTILKIHAKLEAHPAFQKAHPSKMPDAVVA